MTRTRISQPLWLLTLVTAYAPMVWGTTYLVTTEFLPPDRPFLAGAVRSLPAGLALLLWVRRLPQGVWWWRSAGLGVLNIGAFFALLFVAAYRLPGGVAATLGAVQPLWVAVLAWLVLAQTPTLWRLGWGLAGVAGVALLVLNGELWLDPVGLLAGLLGTVSMGTGVVLTRRWGKPDSVLALTAWQFIAGGLLLLPLALWLEGVPPSLDARALAGYLWLAVPGSVIAYWLWFRGIGLLPVSSVSFLGLLSPVVATLLGWWVLGQALSAWQWLGFTLALAAIVGAQFPAPRLVFRTAPNKAGV
ncbi:EamA family transporter [Saccharospirillum mangrovi]|uniref:EamA family transporter n=1 Tax=Saccharospirillum mangrovi TaxID=2161747 RepID=UPI000D342792|nr:EamA family transporter [Saccharospirillum mangrovi]